MTGIPQVVFLKNFISAGKCQGSALLLPITLLEDAATISGITMPVKKIFM
jgi:hypothetical protein